MTPRATFLAKHAARIERDPIYGCWLWTGPIDRDGYGVSYAGGRGPRSAHSEAWREIVGPVPPEMLLDHWCRRRNCIRPEHLEPITNAENQRRSQWRYRSRMKACPRNHSLDTCILTPPEGRNRGAGRICRTCMGPEAASSHGIDAESEP